MKKYECIYFENDEFYDFISKIIADNEKVLGQSGVKKIHIKNLGKQWSAVIRDSSQYTTLRDCELFPLISKELSIKIESSHVEEDGVWFVLQ
jgi:hypothetical protein